MTESATRTTQLTVNQIVTRAFKLAGLKERSQSLSTEELNDGAEILDILTDELATEGIVQKTAEERTTTLLAATQEYSLTADILDIYGDARYMLTGETTERQITKVNQSRWEMIHDKALTGPPTLMQVYRAEETIQLRFWPIPEAADVGTVRYIVHRLRGDTTPLTSATMGAERYWHAHFIHSLARYLAQEAGMNMGRVGALSTQAEAYKNRALGVSRDQGAIRIRFRHPTPWSR